MHDNGLALMKQIVELIKDNIKKEKEFWGDDGDDEKNSAENLEYYNEYGNTIEEQIRLIKNNPKNTQAYLDLEEAIEFQEIFNAHTNDKTQERSYREKIRWLTAGIKQAPNNKKLYRKRADVYFDKEQWQKAKADYSRIIQFDPQDGDAIKSRGRVHEKLGFKKEAQQDFDTYAQIKLETAEEFHSRGLFHYFRDSFDLAEPDFSKDIELDPKKGAGYIFRAEIYFAHNRFDDSLADYKRMIETEPGLAGLGLLRIGYNYYYQGKYKMAEDAFVETLKLNPHLGVIVAWYLSRQKQGKSSKAALEYIADHFSDEHFDSAAIHLFLGKISPKELLKKKSDPPETWEGTTLSSAYFYLGQYYLMRDNFSKAKTMFEKSIQSAKARFMPGSLFSEKELSRMKSDQNSDS